MSLTITVDASKRFPISPLIYGLNLTAIDQPAKLALAGMSRFGGNRTSAWDPRSGYSVAGADGGAAGNLGDLYLDPSGTPYGTVRARITAARERDIPFLLTLPMMGLVATGLNAFTSATVEIARDLVRWTEKTFPREAGKPGVMYGLDNEPDLWPVQFPTLHATPTTYKELIDKSVAFARMVRVAAPGALIFGPAVSGWNGYSTLSYNGGSAPDAAGRFFLDVFLRETAGLIDVLDVHNYPESLHGNVKNPWQVDAATQAARIQSPRSWWDDVPDPTDWISRDALGGKAVRLLPRLREMIAAAGSTAKLAVTEYSFEGHATIHGAIAQVQALGELGRAGAFAAALWEMRFDQPNEFLWAALRCFRDFDGVGSRFGSTGIGASVSDPASASVYASQDAAGRAVIVALNKGAAPIVPTWVGLAGVPRSVHQLTGDAPVLRPVSPAALGALSLPPLSVSVLVLDAGGAPVSPPTPAPWFSIAIDGGRPIPVTPTAANQPPMDAGASLVLTTPSGLTSQPTVLRAPGPTPPAPPPVTPPPGTWDPPITIDEQHTTDWNIQLQVAGASKVELLVAGEIIATLTQPTWDAFKVWWVGAAAGKALGAVTVRVTRASDGVVGTRLYGKWPRS